MPSSPFKCSPFCPGEYCTCSSSKRIVHFCHYSLLLHVSIHVSTCFIRKDVLSLIWLVVSTPLKNLSQIGSSSQLLGKIKVMFQTTNQSPRSLPSRPLFKLLTANRTEPNSRSKLNRSARRWLPPWPRS